MKVARYIGIAFILSVLVFGVYLYIQDDNDIVSPIPEEDGIKVIPIE